MALAPFGVAGALFEATCLTWILFVGIRSVMVDSLVVMGALNRILLLIEVMGIVHHVTSLNI
jgi:hypothetical protein